MGPEYNVRLERVLKNNKVTYDALVIMKNGENMAPTVYLEEYYEEYTQGCDVTEIALSLTLWYEKHKDEISIDISKFSDYSSLKKNIFVKVINLSMNEELLKKLPHISYYDLAMIAYWAVDENGNQIGTANVTNAQLKLWNIEIETLFNDAMENTKRNKPPKLEHMSDVMRELLMMRLKNVGYKVGEDLQMDKALSRAIEEIDAMGEQNIYVLTNSGKSNGAVYMLFEDVLEKIANQLNSDIYIMPSSIHEVLILPKDENADYDHLEEMVYSVNREHVQPEEVLSDSVYLYERGKGMSW